MASPTKIYYSNTTNAATNWQQFNLSRKNKKFSFSPNDQPKQANNKTSINYSKATSQASSEILQTCRVAFDPHPNSKQLNPNVIPNVATDPHAHSKQLNPIAVSNVADIICD